MVESVEMFTERAAQWLAEHGGTHIDTDGLPERPSTLGEDVFSVAVFHDLSFDDERALLDEAQRWQRLKATAGFHAITEPVDVGGLGLSNEHSAAFAALERRYRLPTNHEVFSVTTDLIAPTVNLFGTPEQRERFVAALLSADVLCCQLFSEPGAGSDLAGLACRAVGDGDGWAISGQKVWSSGAQFCEWGLLVARSDPTVPKHRGLTAFLVPMDSPGIEIRPIRQMSGGSSFNEVFLDGCHLPDALRLGDVGDGWRVALTTLGFERDHSDPAGGERPGGRWAQLLATAQAQSATGDPLVRQSLAQVFIHKRVEELLNRRAADLARGGTPGPEGSLGKLMWT